LEGDDEYYVVIFAEKAVTFHSNHNIYVLSVHHNIKHMHTKIQIYMNNIYRCIIVLMATAPLQLAIRDTVKETATGAPPARQPLTQIVHPHIEHEALAELY
jgi:hypothetical protein